MTIANSARVVEELAAGPFPASDGWGWLYRSIGRIAPTGSTLRRLICGYFRPTPVELARDCLLYRALGVAAFGRVIPTGGIAIRRSTGATMRPYTLHRRSLTGAREFYYRACIFEALHLPFFLALALLAVQRLSIGRTDFAIQETVMNLVVNLYPMLHHRHTRARIVRLLTRCAGLRR